MAEVAPLWVEYPADDLAAPPIVVERLNTAAVDDDIARGATRLVRDAYAAQYGGVAAPTATFYEAYDPDNDRAVADRRDAMVERIQKERADYWVVRGDEPGSLEGLVKAMHDARRTYIADVISAPPWRQGIGSRVLHASLTQSGLDPSKIVLLDGFQGSSVNDWYVSLGFTARELSGYFRIGHTDRQMLMREYATPAAVGLGGVVRALEAKRPLLRQAVVRRTAE